MGKMLKLLSIKTSEKCMRAKPQKSPGKLILQRKQETRTFKKESKYNVLLPFYVWTDPNTRSTPCLTFLKFNIISTRSHLPRQIRRKTARISHKTAKQLRQTIGTLMGSVRMLYTYSCFSILHIFSFINIFSYLVKKTTDASVSHQTWEDNVLRFLCVIL